MDVLPVWWLSVFRASQIGGEDGEGGPAATVATKTWQLRNLDGRLSGVKGRLTLRVEEEGDAFTLGAHSSSFTGSVLNSV